MLHCCSLGDEHLATNDFSIFFFKCGYNGDIKLGCSGYIIWDVQRIIEFGIGGSARIRLAREF